MLIAVGILMAAILLVLFVYYAIDVVLLLFGAVLLAIFLHGLASLVNRESRMSQGKAVFLVSFLLLVILAASIALLAPSVAEQGKHLRDELPISATQASNYISQYSWGKTLINQLPGFNEIMTKIEPSAILTRVGGYFTSTVGAIGNFFVMILLAIYLSSEPKYYADGFTKLFPIEMRPRVSEILTKIGTTLSWWLIGKVCSMVFIGILTWIGLWILGVPLALTLGLIAGLLSFIPNFGPIFSAVPAILLAFIESPISAVYVLILFIIVQIIESNLVTPYIERQTVELPPGLTVFAQLSLGVIIGGVGLILATPLLALAVVIVQSVYIEEVLGDKDTEVNENLEEAIPSDDAKLERHKNFKEQLEDRVTE